MLDRRRADGRRGESGGLVSLKSMVAVVDDAVDTAVELPRLMLLLRCTGGPMLMVDRRLARRRCGGLVGSTNLVY